MSGPDGRRPNILFITTDYTRGVDLPSGGAPFLRMPNVDRLCDEGAVFASHVSTCPICMPARATWVTGLYPHTHGLWDNLGRSFPREGPFLVRDRMALGLARMAVPPGAATDAQSRVVLSFPPDRARFVPP
ncbi:MAG: sulfatase-like hydrolase/transferase, partial [Planctomycetota bacterium]